MRSSTKLKALMLMYDVSLTLEDDSWMKMTITEKNTREQMDFTGGALSALIQRAYSYFMRNLKEIEKAQAAPKRKKFNGDNFETFTPFVSKHWKHKGY